MQVYSKMDSLFESMGQSLQIPTLCQIQDNPIKKYPWFPSKSTSSFENHFEKKLIIKFIFIIGY